LEKKRKRYWFSVSVL